jgi:hypothetical protein
MICDTLDEIITKVCRDPHLSLDFNKTKVYKKVAYLLNGLGGNSWTWRYIGNLHRGVQVDEAGAEIKHAIQWLSDSLQPKKTPYQSIALKCSPEVAKKIRSSFTTEERTEIFLSKLDV